MYTTIPPDDECTVAYGAGAETLKTTTLDANSPTRFVDVLSGEFNADAKFFSVRVDCMGSSEGLSIAFGSVSLDVEG